MDASRREIRVRGYDARMVIPLSWDQGEVTECAFVTRAFDRENPVDQLQMHVRGVFGYQIRTVCFDQGGERVCPEGVLDTFDTYSRFPTFAIVRPANENTLGDPFPHRVGALQCQVCERVPGDAIDGPVGHRCSAKG